MSVTPSAAPWPTGSAPASPPYDGIVIGKRWATQLAETYIALSPLTHITTDVSQSADNTGEIKIPRKPTVVTSVYEEGAPIALTRPSAPVRSLNLSRADGFFITLDTVLKSQSSYDLPAIYRAEAMRTIAGVQAAHFVPLIAAAVPAVNKGATAGAVTGDVNLGTAGTPLPIANISAALAAGFEALDQQNVPARDGRWVLVSFRIARQIRSLIKFGDERPPEEWPPVVTMWAGAPVLVSAALAADTMLVGHRSGVMWATQVVVKEAEPTGEAFATIIRGVVVSGLTVTSAEAVAEVRVA